MKKHNFILAFLLGYICMSLAISNCHAQNTSDGIPQGLVEAVDAFYDEATLRSAAVRPIEVKIRVAPLLDNNGVLMVNEGHCEIVIDSDFYNYFYSRSQLRRLVFNLMAQALLDAPKAQRGNSILNDSQVYRKLKRKMVDKMFESSSIHAVG